MNYNQKLDAEYDRDPQAFEKRTKEIKQDTQELIKMMRNFGNEVDGFLKEK